jgi:predicted nucleotide-binding protein
MGYFLGTLGRRSGRIILLYRGPIDLPSDISGVIFIDISGGIEAAGESIRKEVAHAAA